MEELQPIIINLNHKDKNKISEAVGYKIASDFSILMRMLFGGAPSVPVTIRGTPGQVASFGSALGKEKKYMDAYVKHGLNDPKTLRSKHLLARAVEKFERATGLRWPFR
tara:strand:+ start:391 stop:717 length:327 start_codon:yes stop_codon:yes gene_type:complete